MMWLMLHVSTAPIGGIAMRIAVGWMINASLWLFSPEHLEGKDDTATKQSWKY